MKKHPILTGTLILSGAGLISRVIGFLYRIYLSRTFGAQAVGILQMIAPVTAMVFAVSCSGIQTALSKRIAELPDSRKHLKRYYLFIALFFSVGLSALLALFVRHFSSVIASEYLNEPQTQALLSVIALSYPLSAVHCCFAGYLLGQRKVRLPAACQLLEQAVRVGTVIILCETAKSHNSEVSLSFAVIGSLAGELASVCVCLIFVCFLHGLSSEKPEACSAGEIRTALQTHAGVFHDVCFCVRQLFSMAAPLSLNRLAMNFLQSLEAVRIPLSLRLYGFTDTEALTVYGILTGMALPVLFFPGAIIGPFSQMLMPTVSQAHGRKEYSQIKTITVNTSFILVFVGMFCSLFLFLFSDFLGTVIFQEPLSAAYIRSLCLLCPLMYLNQVLSGILQGLGDAFGVLFINTVSVFTRLCFVFFAIPQIGIRGYFYGLLFSQLSAAVLFLYKCLKLCQNK